MMQQEPLFPTFRSPQQQAPVNVASVPQRSVFRYPGGKTWLVPVFRRFMARQSARLGQSPALLVETFAGGGIIGLTAAFEQLAQKVLLVELDEQVAAVWQALLGGEAEWLAKRVLQFELTTESLRRTLHQQNHEGRERAFATLLKNRTAHGGILAEGAGTIKSGENGRGITSRWYPETLAQRIRNIQSVTAHLTFEHGNAFDVIARHKADPNTVFFIDPPYTAGGKRAGQRLYKYAHIDHELLFLECSKTQGDFLMTYDNTQEVVDLASRYGFCTKAIAMKNTHHAKMTELLISKDLSWLD